MDRLARQRLPPLVRADRRLRRHRSRSRSAGRRATARATASRSRSARARAAPGTGSTPGLWDHDLEAYYKDEIVIGFEWQFANNWAFDAKGIVYELGDMIGNTTQSRRVPQRLLLQPDRELQELQGHCAIRNIRARGGRRAHADGSRVVARRFARGARSTRRSSSRSTAASPRVGRSTPTSPGPTPRRPGPAPGGTTLRRPTARTWERC